jgi:rod shape-determining protein MreB
MAASTFTRLRSLVATPDIAVDLGNANTRVYALGRGLVADEPSIIAVRKSSGSVVAVGTKAARLGDDEDIQQVYPMQAGVIADVQATSDLLQPLIGRARGRFNVYNKPRVLICAPSGTRDDEREALVEATRRAGAASVSVAPEPLAAAIGAGLDVSSEYAQMLVDIGDGITDIAVIRSGRLVTTKSMRRACSDMHRAVRVQVARDHGVKLYAREAERLTRILGATRESVRDASLVVCGRDNRTGGKTTARITSEEVCTAIDPVILEIVGLVRSVVNELPATTACEVIESGISLTGGGATLKGLSAFIASETSLDVRPADDPLRAVIEGARQMLTVAIATGVLVTS